MKKVSPVFLGKKIIFYIVVATLVLSINTRSYVVSADEDVDSGTTNKQKLDIMFVIDNSGSMKKNDPMFITRDVVTRFSTAIPDNSRLGMVIFDKDAKLLEPLTEKTGRLPDEKFIESLKKVNYRGQYTNSPAGVERAIYEIKTRGRDEVERVIIFLTDGIIDTGNKQQDIEKEKWLREDLTKESKKAGIRIFGIAFTEKADVSLMQTLALKTNGEYFRALSAEDIPGIFAEITRLINKPRAEIDLSPDPEPVSESRPHEEQQTSKLNNQEKGFSAPILLIIALVLLMSLLSLRLSRGRSEKSDKTDRSESVPDLSSQSGEPIPDARLIDIQKVSSKWVLPLVLDKSRISIGRDSRNDVVILQPTVSSFHATIEFIDGYFYLEDHRSTNGTSLNGIRINENQSTRLKSGDRLSFSTYEFKFVLQDRDPVGETIMLKSYSHALEKDQVHETESSNESDESAIFKDCFNKHLKRISHIGASYKSFVDLHINDHIVDIFAEKAIKTMGLSRDDLDGHINAFSKPPVLYQLCYLPMEMDKGQAWFANKFGGYINFLNNALKSKIFTSKGCSVLCVIIYGRTDVVWTSATIISTEDNPEPIDIISFEFLSEEEKRTLSLEYGDLGQVIQ